MLFYLGNLFLYGNKENVSTKKEEKSKKARFSQENGLKKWPKSLKKTQSQGS